MPKDADQEIQVQQHPVEHVIQEKPKRKWQSYLWDSLDKSPEERKFLFKLDAAVLTFACLGYFIKALDQNNINNAFVSGMKEDLSLYGNELNYMQTLWTVGYVLGEIPSNMILTRVRPSIWIPFLEVAWTILTFCTCRCNTAQQLYVVRFFVGLFEAGFYPGMQYIVGSWYRKDELAKRSCILHASGHIASMFSGYLMAAVYNLEGVQGFRGWQWLFIIDGIISLPVAVLGVVFLPDMPETTRAWYFSEEEKAFGLQRMHIEGRRGREPYTRAKFRKIFSSWHIYALTILYIVFNNGGSSSAPVFAQFLKNNENPTYTVTQINVYPTITQAVVVVSTLAYAWSSDTFLKGARWPPMIFGGVFNIITCASLAVWDIPLAWKWACYILAAFGVGLSGLCFAWAHEICADDNEERALVTATMNEMAYVIQAWLPLVMWQQVDAPEYHKGFVGGAVLSALLVVIALVVRVLHKREIKQKSVSTRSEESDSDGKVDVN